MDFGRKILDTISLQIKSKAPLQDIAKLLSDLKDNLNTQQSESDYLHDSQVLECETDINNYENRINYAQNEIQEATVNIGSLSTEKKRLKGSIENANSQLSILAKRESILQTNHDQDIQDFDQRVQDHTQVLEALEIIIPKLEAITSQDSTPQSVLAELAKIGKSNPIAALVEVAASLDPEALETVINKLNEIRNSVQNSLQNDKLHQEESNINYNNLLSEISNVRESQIKRIEEDSEALNEAQAKFDQETTRKQDNQNELSVATDGKNEKQKICLQWEAQYETEREQRYFFFNRQFLFK